jgi:hypothetical protein
LIRPRAEEEKCPGFITFIGKSGSGKSFLLWALMSRRLAGVTATGLGDAAGTEDVPLPIPAPPASNNMDSTSSDVNIYPDPWSRDTPQPLFFVDTEGLQGSSRPKAIQAIQGGGWWDNNSNSHSSRQPIVDTILPKFACKYSQEQS